MGGSGRVRTVLGDVEAHLLGPTLGHEHLIGRPPDPGADPDLTLDDEAAAAAELARFRRAGGGALVEMTTPDYGRDAPALARISRASGVHIVAATGFNQAAFADRYSAAMSEDALAAWMTREVERGVVEPPDFVSAERRQGGAVRAGVIKASSSLGGPSPAEEKVLRAAGRAHRATGAPVGTHTQRATWALEQAAFLLERGVAPGKLLIGHLDFRPDPVYLAEIASLGVYLGLDQFGKDKYLPDERRVALVLELVARGHGERLILAGDMARRSSWGVHGGAGFAHVPTTVAARLAAAGLDEDGLDGLLQRNPQRWLAFDPGAAVGRAHTDGL